MAFFEMRGGTLNQNIILEKNIKNNLIVLSREEKEIKIKKILRGE